MDKKLLNALNNLSESLEMISDALNSKEESTSSTGAALKGGNFGKQLQEINASISLVRDDTQQILKNQQTIISLSKEKSKDAIEEAGADKKKQNDIKKGVGTILLIATAVLAIGLALKLVGQVDIVSAIGLGIAMVAIGFAFSEVAKVTDGMDIKQIGLVSLSIVMMSIAVTLSSWALSLISPISVSQGITAILIAGVFTVISYGMSKMIRAFKGVNTGDIIEAAIFLPLLLPSIALGIVGASYALSYVQPISLMQWFSSILIASIFVVISYGMVNMLKAFKGLDSGSLIEAGVFLPLLLPAIALGIAGASYALSLVQPISLMQWFSSILIGALFVVLSFGIVNITKAMSKMKWGDIVKLPVFFTLIATAIMISSHILVYTADIEWGTLLKAIAVGLAMSILSLTFAPAMILLGKLGVGQLLKGGLAVVIVATAVMVSSHILSLGNYENFPDISWVLGAGLALVTFGLASFGLGLLVFGPQALIFFAGMAATLAVAASIVGVSKILSEGSYDNPGMLDWAKSVSLLYMTFTPVIFALGAMGLASAVMSFFGPDPFEMAKSYLIQIAESIVAISHILKDGDYSGGPTKEWADGISIALGAFMPVYGMMMMNNLLSIFGGGVGPEEFSEAIMTVSGGIIVAASVFAGAESSFKKPPPVEWAEGVGGAIGAFAPVYSALMNSGKGLFSSAVTPEQMKSAIMTISEGIVDAAVFFADNEAPFDEGNYPSVEWGEGVGAALGAFSPVFEMLSGKSWYKSDEGVISGMVNGVTTITRAIVRSARILHLGRNYFKSTIDPNFIESLSSNIKGYLNLAGDIKEAEDKNSSWIKSLMGGGQDPIVGIANNMMLLAESYDKLSTSFDKFGTSLDKINMEKLKEVNSINPNKLGNTLEEVTPKEEDGIFSKIGGMMSSMMPTFGGNKEKDKVVDKSDDSKFGKDGRTVPQQLDELISILSRIDQSTQTIDEFIEDATNGRIVNQSNELK